MMAGKFPQSASVRRWLERGLIGILAAAILTYLFDCGVFMLRGKPLGQITVDSYLAVPLKGSKTEYDYEGSQPTACALALFPQAGLTPCWYLRRHTSHADNL
jgi:hypothetical protein